MRHYLKLLIPLLAVSLIFVGCDSDTEVQDDKENSPEESQKESEEAVEEVNLYSGKERPTNLLDIDHTQYDPIENIEYESINYMDEEIFIASGMGADVYSDAIEMETNERIWEDDIRVKIDGHLPAPIYDDLLYFRDGDDRGTITLDTDKSNNEVSEVDEEEYQIRVNEHVYEDNAYVVEEENEDDYVLISYNVETLEEQWEFELDDYSGVRGEIVETGDYVLLDTGEFQVFVLDKTNGEVMFEEGDENFYNDAVQVEDKLYAVNVNGLTDEFLTLYSIDTNTWEKEEVLTYTNEDFLASTTEVNTLEHIDDKLLFIYEYGAYIIDLETETVTHDFIYDDKEAEGVVTDIVSLHTFTHDSKMFTLFEHDYHKTLSIIDVQTGEVLDEYGFGLVTDEGNPTEYRLTQYGAETITFDKISDDKFVVVTRDDGIFEYEFADIE